MHDLLSAIAVVAALPAAAPVTTPAGTPAPVREEDARLAITLAHVDYELAAHIYRPVGPGPFPLVVLHHGIPGTRAQLAAKHPGFVRAARWFAWHGMMAVVALRPGFGTSGGPYLEDAGPCADHDYGLGGRRTAEIEAAIVVAAARLPQADPRRIVVVGQSAGGFGATALADAPPAGVVGIISFAGGRGSDGHGRVCGGDERLIEAERQFGRANRLPQLWLYAANDHVFAPDLARRMATAYAGGSTPPVEFVLLPAFGDEGHDTLPQADPAVWAAPVTAFLRRVLR